MLLLSIGKRVAPPRAVSGCEWDIRVLCCSSGLGDGESVNLIIVVLCMGSRVASVLGCDRDIRVFGLGDCHRYHLSKYVVSIS